MSGDDNSPWSYRVPGRGVDEAEEAGLRLGSGKGNRAQAGEAGLRQDVNLPVS